MSKHCVPDDHPGTDLLRLERTTMMRLHRLHLWSVLTGVLTTVLLGICLYFFLYAWGSIDTVRLPSDRGRLLVDLGARALAARDVPVGALLLYGDRVVGSGFNTVTAARNAAGHAEINALSDAMKRLGVERFKALDRDSLVLVSTYEPCPMCRGALLEYNVRRVWYGKAKPFGMSVRQDARTIRYFLERRSTGDAELQDSLFGLHPTYDKKRR